MAIGVPGSAKKVQKWPSHHNALVFIFSLLKKRD
jgi:hypothetical protein